MHGILREALGMAACVAVAIPVLMLTATGVQGANPAGPDIAGTWDTTAPIANPTCTNSTLDIQDLTSGIATIGSGATLTMRGANAKFMDVASDVIQGDLATVNGTFRFDNGFSLTPGGGGTLTVSSSGTFGADGTLSGNLSCAGTYRAEVAGGDADLLTVNGTVTLTGSPTLTIVETAYGTSSQYILIENDGTDPVVGTFANSTVEFAGRTYNISYTMGTDNNDVGITFIPSGSVLIVW